MTENLCHIAGTVKHCNIRRAGSQEKPLEFGSIWAIVQLESINVKVDGAQYIIPSNELEVNCDGSWADDLNGKSTARLEKTLKSGCTLLVSSGKIANVKKSRKLDNGTWEKYEEIGFKGSNARSLAVFNDLILPYNTAIVSGKVIQQKGNKLRIEDKYKVPKTGEYRIIQVPVLLPDDLLKEYVGKYLYVHGSVCGKNSKGESKTFVVAKHAMQI